MGDYAYVFERGDWRIVKKVECDRKWDFIHACPFAGVKSLYCTDGFVIMVKPEVYGHPTLDYQIRRRRTISKLRADSTMSSTGWLP